MGPDELRDYAAEGAAQHGEAERELRRRWATFDGFLPETPFKSVLDPDEE